MDLLSSPLASEVLDIIRARFGPQTMGDVGGLNDFFWLNAMRPKSQDDRLAIWPTYEKPPVPEKRHGPAPVRLCNLVLQGGGTLGLAHAGFITGMEAAGVRFVGLAGTSAGSIVAMGMAAIRGDDLTKEISRDLVDISQAVPMDNFIDGPRPIRVLIKRALKKHALYRPQFWPGLIAALLRLRDRRGLNHGTAFEQWFETIMNAHGCRNISDLYASLDQIWNDLADLRNLKPFGTGSDPVLRDPVAVDATLSEHPGTALLQLISMAMPVGLKFKLPQDLYYLSAQYQNTSPARLVRTSMSIPAFFDPVVMQTNPTTWPQRVRKDVSDLLTKDQAARFEDLDELVFLDGGLMSNLPSDSFRDLMPQMPSIVVPLINGRAAPKITRRRRFADLTGDAAACIGAVRLQRDRETWAQNSTLKAHFDQAEAAAPDVLSGKRRKRRYPVAIAPIKTGDANWLNFTMSGQEKAALFEAGLQAAHDLLETLDLGDPT